MQCGIGLNCTLFFSFVKDKSVISAGMVASEASKGMGPDEESFNVPVPVTQKVHILLCHVS